MKQPQVLLLMVIVLLYPSFSEGSQKTCLRVEGMVCGKCVKKVEDQLSKVKGIKTVSVSLQKEKVVIESDGPVNPKEVKTQLDAIHLKADTISCDPTPIQKSN